ncbi:helix-turn-helix domain-containing protein [Gordonia amicalis]|uniref:helix-turn-helix domain-containing protein n=1 Tax=Gordonia amicalis TaxID=89053 RepID=UPI0024BA445E|nr:helix-turn-helix domain-containing protein [Gordonia amicalis]MDJ0454066.1 helix-turn-helix domain-containing protein [Gordonia amicalis]MDV7077210.1 helix-turn-helix domain-containing protein [Gordonia amicalis]
MPVAPVPDAELASALSAAASAGRPLSYYTALDDVPCKATMVRAIHADQLRATMVGGEYRLTPEDVADWLERRRRPANTVSSTLTPDLREWAEKVAAEAPALAPTQAAEVARILAGGAAA